MRRLLPECCYDFTVRDGRDGETWGPFDTMAEAQRERALAELHDRVHFECFEICWTVNERKVLKLLPTRRARKGGGR